MWIIFPTVPGTSAYTGEGGADVPCAPVSFTPYTLAEAACTGQSKTRSSAEECVTRKVKSAAAWKNLSSKQERLACKCTKLLFRTPGCVTLLLWLPSLPSQSALGPSAYLVLFQKVSEGAPPASSPPCRSLADLKPALT